jgi:chromosome segregation ATPase
MATKTQTITTLSPARQSLKEGLEAQQRARAIVDKAAKVVDAAHAAVERAREDAVKHDEMGADSVKERLALLKGEPAKSQDEIREARRNRLIAKEELTASDETLRAAQSELEEYRGNVLRGQKTCNSHVTSVISECVTDTIAEFDKVSQELQRLRVILNSLIMTPGVALDMYKPEQQHQIIRDAVSQAGLPMGDAADWRRLQDKCGGALSRNYAQQDPGPGIARARAYWAKFAGELMVDPTIEQAPPPSADVLFR